MKLIQWVNAKWPHFQGFFLVGLGLGVGLGTLVGLGTFVG